MYKIQQNPFEYPSFIWSNWTWSIPTTSSNIIIILLTLLLPLLFIDMYEFSVCVSIFLFPFHSLFFFLFFIFVLIAGKLIDFECSIRWTRRRKTVKIQTHVVGLILSTMSLLWCYFRYCYCCYCVVAWCLMVQ